MVGGNQALSLQAGGCTYVGTVAHELIHALGRFYTIDILNPYVFFNFSPKL